MNNVVLMGRLTRDPEVRYLQGGEESKAVANFTLAVDRRVARNDGQNTADFISIQAWGKRAEFAEKYLVQGTKVVIGGRIQTGSYTNKDGEKVYTTVVVAEDIEFAESKAKNDGSKKGFDAINAPVEVESFVDGFMNIPMGIDEELPFGR